MISNAQIKSVLRQCARILRCGVAEVPARIEQLLAKEAELKEQWSRMQEGWQLRTKLAAVRKELKRLREVYPDHPVWSE